MAVATSAAAVRGVWAPNLGDRRDDLSGHTQPFGVVVSCDVVGHDPKERSQRFGASKSVGVNRYETAWTWLHKMRRAMVRPGRDLLAGRVEVDESYLGGLEEGPLFRAKPRKRRNLRFKEIDKALKRVEHEGNKLVMAGCLAGLRDRLNAGLWAGRLNGRSPMDQVSGPMMTSRPPRKVVRIKLANTTAFARALRRRQERSS